MRILAVADEECKALWDYYTPGKLKEYDLIISCGDLRASYLTFLVTMGRGPLMYVHGNHDTHYAIRPPEGCADIDGQLVLYRGLRILGLGGCRKYRPAPHQYSEKEMRKRIRKLKREIRLVGGVDVLVTHAPPRGVGDGEDPAHMGFECLLDFIDQYHPAYLLHGHVHSNYGYHHKPEQEYHGTQVINVSDRYTLDIPDPEPISPVREKIWRYIHRKSDFLY